MFAGQDWITGQGPLQLEELTLAFILSAIVGVEREIRQKSAGLRTYTLVGVAAALFMLVSKYGFMDVLQNSRVVVDPSRVAAQVVSGIGFIGGGVIFMRRDVVRGLTTAASVWVTAALGMACGAGLPVLALATTLFHLVIMLGFPRIVRLLPRERRTASRITVTYQDGRGLLRTILIACTELRFAIDQVQLDRQDPTERPGTVTLSMLVKGKRPIAHLVAGLTDIDGVLGVNTAGDDAELE